MKLQVDHLGFAYNETRDIFSDISFEMESGSLLCLLGPNGCGKTTLLNCLAGLLKYKTGDVKLDGASLGKMAPSQRARTVGYVPQTITATFDYTVLDYVVTGSAPYMKLMNRPKEAEYAKAWAALEKMNIAHLADMSYARISGGERQQVSIARVVVQEPSFILLDQPTSHLDFGNQERLLRLVKSMSQEGYGVLMTTHNPDQVLSLNADVIMMHKVGNYQTGFSEDIITEESLQELYGINVLLEKSDRAGRSVCATKCL